MNNESTSRPVADIGPVAVPSASLHRYIARTLRVNARHLPWEIAQQIHAEDQMGETCGAFPSTGGLLILELDEYSWRAEVTADNIAAAQALGWDALRRLLRLAQAYQCEALELAGDHPLLPAALAFEVFAWP